MNGSEAATSILERLSAIPGDADVSLVIRHAEREEIPAGSFGHDVSLTAGGVAAAERLGMDLAASRTVTVVSSPVPRCLHTAKAVLRGGGRCGEVAQDWRLGDPGPFVVDTDVSGRLFLEIGILEIVRRQLSDDTPPPGMRLTAEGIELLLSLTSADLGRSGRLNLYVTHDGILAAFVAGLYRLPVCEIRWPKYLDGLLLWHSGKRLHFIWRGLEQRSHPLGS